MSNTLQIDQTFTVGDQAFSTQAEAEAFIAQQQRLKKIQVFLEAWELEALELDRSANVASLAPCLWDSAKAAARLDQSPLWGLLIAATALHGRDAEALGVPSGLAAALAELVEDEMPGWLDNTQPWFKRSALLH